jgi:hypothetical protein
VKIRVEKQLLDRARVCADAVDASLSSWCGLALRVFRKGGFPVASDEICKNATRGGSVVCTLPGDQSDADDMRRAIQAAVAHCEAVRGTPFSTPLVEGRDYIVGGEW